MISTPPNEADAAFGRWKTVKSDLARYGQKDMSEADTRVKIIDGLFKDVLGWTEDVIDREFHAGNGYVDYRFEGSANRFVVEAKRTGTYFALPHNCRPVLLAAGLVDTVPALKNALGQAITYGKNAGFPVVVISNGLQLVVSRADRNRLARILIFNGDEDIERRFVQLWEMLSPYGSAAASLAKAVEGPGIRRGRPSFKQTVLQDVYNSDAQVAANALETALRPLLSSYFGEITSPEKERLLTQAYCDSERQAQYGSQLEEYLRDRMPRLIQRAQPLQVSKRSAGAFQTRHRASVAARQGGMFLIVGGVGVGKSTFVNRFHRRILTEPMREQAKWCYIDLLTLTKNATLEDFIATAMLEQFHKLMPWLTTWEGLRSIYKLQIDERAAGLLRPFANDPVVFDRKISEWLEAEVGDERRHAEAIISFWQRRDLAVCIVLDNADQLSAAVQEEVFVCAHDLSTRLRCVTLVAIREDTYWQMHGRKPFDAFNPVVYHVLAPRVANVLSKRLDVLASDRGQERLIADTPSGQHVHMTVDVFVRIMRESFLLSERENRRSIELLETLCRGDMRKALRMFDSIVTSGHTDVRKYVEAHIDQSVSPIPFDIMLKGLALGSRQYYRSDKSQIVNLFSIATEGFWSHTAKLRLLKHLESMRSSEAFSKAGKGYVSWSHMTRLMNGICDDVSEVRALVAALLRPGLVESDTGETDADSREIEGVRISSAGYYYVEHLVCEPTYLECVAYDTEVRSRGWYDRIRSCEQAMQKVHPARQAGARMEFVQTFLGYLNESERLEVQELDAMGSGGHQLLMPAVLARVGGKRAGDGAVAGKGVS